MKKISEEVGKKLKEERNGKQDSMDTYYSIFRMSNDKI